MDEKQKGRNKVDLTSKVGHALGRSLASDTTIEGETYVVALRSVKIYELPYSDRRYFNLPSVCRQSKSRLSYHLDQSDRGKCYGRKMLAEAKKKKGPRLAEGS